MRTAAVDIAAEVLGSIAPILQDGDLTIIGSTFSPVTSLNTVRLLICGDSLPPECEDYPLKQVSIIFQTETYGRQRINRILRIEVIGVADPQKAGNVSEISNCRE